jgi:hypothetical protein
MLAKPCGDRPKGKCQQADRESEYKEKDVERFVIGQGHLRPDHEWVIHREDQYIIAVAGEANQMLAVLLTVKKRAYFLPGDRQLI